MVSLFTIHSSPFTLRCKVNRQVDCSSATSNPVIDLNHILLFIACISPLVMLAQTLRRGGLYRPWRPASFAALIVTRAACLVNGDTAGYVGGGAWLALLLLPAIGRRRVSAF